MGYVRPRPERLAEKLRQIRTTLGISQSEMHRRLDPDQLIAYNQISGYETGNREPPLFILLQYARVAGIHMEALVDDDLDLPAQLPGPVKHGSIATHYASRKRTRGRTSK